VRPGFALATHAAATIAAILCLAAPGGRSVTASVRHLTGCISGGIVQVWMGLIMLRETASPTTATESEADDDSPTSLINFSASPGTITGVKQFLNL
jgi:small neutral amino acid transporter SnatA (MarC family)